MFNQGGLYGSGAVYQLSFSGSGWTEQNLHDFMPQGGEYPVGGLIIDASGNLYGDTTVSMNNNGGFAVESTPAGGGWTYTLLPNLGIVGPDDRLFLDGTGNLFGTAYQGGLASVGSVFKLTPSDGGWTYTTLHDFCTTRPCTDGQNPISNVVFDRDGNLYGTTSLGGTGSACSGGCGVAFEITP